MKHTNSILLFVFSVLLGFQSMAGPGDTIMIQTIEYEGFPPGSGWLAPREGYFDFSAVDDKEFSKVFVHYNLKCDDSQNPACGEWDYLSYLKVMEHTGIGYHPSYIVGGQGGLTPATFDYMNEVSWKYQSRFENEIVFNSSSQSEYELGTGSSNLSHPFNAAESDSRAFYLFRADELSASGLTVGEITGIQFNVNSLGDAMQRVNIRIKATSDNELSGYVEDTDFTTVYAKNSEITETGWVNFDFTDFFTWDGSSNMIVDINFASPNGNTATTVKGSTLAWNCTLLSSHDDYCFNFNGPDLVSAPVDNLTDLEEEVTISFWQFGGPEQPQSDGIFEAKDANGARILNIHLPWSDGRVYWDAGTAAHYDRIDKTADNAEQYRGKWNHWAFTKKAALGQMKIFLNGELWHSSTGKFMTIGAIDTLLIGKNIGGSYYDGKIDEVQVWSKSLEEETIAAWMYKDIDASHPDYEFLKIYYQFDELDGLQTSDVMNSEAATVQGVPDVVDYNGQRVKDFTSSQERPQVKFNRNSSDYTITTNLVIDSFPQGQTQLTTYIQESAGATPVVDEELFVYPAYYNHYQYDENGIATDSSMVEPDVELTLEMIEYNTSEPGVEILIPWEIGRFITPYGNNLSLGADGWTWVYDVTDFQHLLQGDNVHISAGNFQELLDMKFYFVEGTPPRDVLETKKLYSKNVSLSNFDNVIIDTAVELLPEAKMFTFKTTVTGHGFGSGANCGEFCSNVHSVHVNGNEEYSWDIIQECGENALYPQGGTWFYDRAGWCPGMAGKQQNFDITPFVNVGVDTEVNVDYNIEEDPYGNYVTEIFFVSYDEPNFANDASIEEIIAPNKFKENGRFNPICGNPIIRIKNTGAENLTTLNITYGIEGMTEYNYTWEGSLEFLQEEIVELPTVDRDEFFGASNKRFNVTISSEVDEYEHNNINTSTFEVVDEYAQQIIIEFKTNTRPFENSYEVHDMDGNIVYYRTQFEASTIHYDTLNLDLGCYKYIAYDTGGDGMYNWPSNHGTGHIKLRTMDGSLVANLESWFGEFISHEFVNTAYPVRIDDREKLTFNIYPNPSDGLFNIELMTNPGDYQVHIYSPAGALVYETNINSQSPGTYQLNLSDLDNGLYLINVTSGDFNMFKKIIIEK
ncbi:T9SS type A sorting domain-containing protein [Lentimicrobium sp. S6]|uniref:T9SS type A sorting domain-containing protein n=1 Tax=Lentimicrobium sp. S6 TaxID=2735872 RepID=UPI00155724CF|nr:LamG-like jellyroll fold domain-containing protein [Lentimicrobium sp. S6]NPD44602.1 T9SS type A sorting domain-containing protein [Lentimicrobium sp. S6]